MEGFAQALARRASDREKFLARPRKLLVPDDRTGLLSSPARYMHLVPARQLNAKRKKPNIDLFVGSISNYTCQRQLLRFLNVTTTKNSHCLTQILVLFVQHHTGEILK